MQWSSPVAFAATILLDAGWIDTRVASFAEVAREMLFGSGGSVGESDVVTITGLVGASH